MAAGSKVLIGSPSAELRWKKARTRSGMSSGRSRNGGKTDRHDIEAEEQVLAKGALLDREAQVLICRRHNPYVGLNGGAAANGRIFALLQHTKKNGSGPPSAMSPISSRNRVPPSACSKRPTERAAAPVKAPFSWPNNSLSMRSRGMAAMLMATNGPPLRLPIIVQCLRDEFLACAGFAGNHHRKIGLHQAGKNAKNVLHRR